jgi:hypothetical protein
MAFTFKLEHEDGAPADPPTLHTAVPTWRPGDTIPVGPGKTLRVIGIRRGRDADVLVVETSDLREAPLQGPCKRGKRTLRGFDSSRLHYCCRFDNVL